MAQCSKISDDLLTEGKENQKIWSVSTPAGKSVQHVIILNRPELLRTSVTINAEINFCSS